ncbi:EF-hand domain-containing protein [Asticcacaulis sp. EMRT-3]|uniref:EF-hand domain-containing protein n=1 Tax=Asticcacaulis sp. EMRT-3 TaxID=3040349 RepID=UPI0024AE9B67|nr:EF-hand domain-containing protein [Asticcacaulis sp. EMRT-3]MDI7775363.1 EF-hand domain-containing protein [Asticcacaulis sp. EMRT-3]
MSRITLTSSALVAVLLTASGLTAGVAFAQGQGMGQGMGQGGGHDRGGPLGMLGRYDTDHDGKISLAEYEAGRQMMFNRMDADGNGAISFAEIDAMAQRMNGKGGRGAERMQKRLDALKAADTNGDQSISADEFKAAADAEFKALDKNGDGFIEASEVGRP